MNNREFYAAIRDTKRFDGSDYEALVEQVSQDRINKISNKWAQYLKPNLEDTIDAKQDIDDYRLNPYAITAIAGILDFESVEEISEFIFGAKLYMSLETAFGKSVENIVMPVYPIPDVETGWKEHPEKVKEMQSDGRGEDLAWQKIDKYCVVDDTAYLATVKSGPRTLNESTTDSMKSDIATHSDTWLEGTRNHHPGVDELEVIIGLTYGTDNSTDSKEMRVLLKLVEEGFVEKDRQNHPGVIVHPDNQNITVHTQVGIDFWSFVANPQDPQSAEYAFLEVLLGLIKASDEAGEALKGKTAEKVKSLEEIIDGLAMPDSTYPDWIDSEFGDDELVRLAQTLTLYYDEGFRQTGFNAFK
jgi:hypothetical protein